MSEFRLIIGRSRHMVLRMVEEGMPVWEKPTTRGRDYLFNLADCLRWMIDREGAAEAVAEGGDEGALDLNSQRARLAKQQADKVEMENAHMRGRLVDAEKVKVEILRYVGAANARLGALPSKWSPIVRPDDPVGARRYLEIAIEEVRADLRE